MFRCGSCFEYLPELSNGSVDMVLMDLPWGITQSKRDIPLDLNLLWEHLWRVTKENAAIVSFAGGKFSCELQNSSPFYRYKWIWVKNKVTGFLNANRMPMRSFEEILVFYKKLPTYNPQMSQGHDPMHYAVKGETEVYGQHDPLSNNAGTTERYPRDVLFFDVVNNDDPTRIHENQKPLDLLQYLIYTYSNEGDLVLDPCAGSGSHLKAARLSNRNWIGYEIDPELYTKACEFVLDL